MSQKASCSKRKSPDTLEYDEATIKKALRLQTGADKKAEMNVATLGEVLPSFEKNSNGVISNIDLEKLFHALCGDTGKEYDSDDSIISEIDHMDDDIIAEKDKRVKEVFDSLSNIDTEIKCVEDTLNIGNESKEVREARRKKIREMQQGLTTEAQKEAAEKKRLRGLKRLEDLLKEECQPFTEKKKSRIMFITCSTLASVLEVMADIVSDEEDEERNHRNRIKEIDPQELAKKIKFMGIRTNFFKNDKSAEDFVLSKVRNILTNSNVLKALNGKVFGFNFTTKECLLTLEKYYTFNKPQPDDGSSVKPLVIHIRALVKAAFHVARDRNSAFVPNDKLKSVLFD